MYASIVMVQSEEAVEVLNMLEDNPESAIEYLAQWDMGSESEVDLYTKAPWGCHDEIFRKGNYIVSWNSAMGYAALCREL